MLTSEFSALNTKTFSMSSARARLTSSIFADALVSVLKEAPMKLNYIIQLDRRSSNDCVFYDCDNKEFTKYVESFGFLEGIGSFSDISVICLSWGIAGVNLSVGYDSSSDVDYGEVNISSTNASSWSSSAIDATNKMFVGVPANYEQAKTGVSGDYLCLRNYQWYDWTNKDKSSISASYTIDESKIINTVEFDYFIESASFEGKEMEVSIIITDVNNVTKVVDNFVIANESVSKNTDIHYTNTIEDSVKIKEFSIKITTFDEDLSSGGKSSAIFIKNIKCSYSV